VNEASLVFKKSLVGADPTPYVFDSIAKTVVRDTNRQGAWLEIMDLKLAPPFDRFPNVAKHFTNLPLKIVAYCGYSEFASKDSFQDLSITRDKDELLASVFLRVESEAYLNGIASSLKTHKELSLWMRLDYKDDKLVDIGDLQSIPVQHLSLTFT
jgi:hypothetical protein